MSLESKVLRGKEEFKNIQDEIDYLKVELREANKEVHMYENKGKLSKEEKGLAQRAADYIYKINKRLSNAYDRKRKSLLMSHNIKSLNFAPYTYGSDYRAGVNRGYVSGITL